jgi:carboxylate-amine ligase
VNALVGAGVIEDATRLWWDLRPSARYPTLEMRASDMCTRLDDAMAVAATFLSLLSMLFHRRTHNQRWRIYSRMLIDENTWRAQRYGVSESLIDFGKGRLVPYGELVEELIDVLMPDAEKLGCVPELEHVRTIAGRGTSADEQLRIYHQALDEGASEEEALHHVVDWLIAETVNF